MHIEAFRDYCLTKKGTTEDLPFDENTLCFRVMGKIFAITDLAVFDTVTLKCDPGRVAELRERYQGIQPGYHMNKKHWNTVMMDGSVPDVLFRELIDHSYDMVVKGLTKAQKEALSST